MSSFVWGLKPNTILDLKYIEAVDNFIWLTKIMNWKGGYHGINMIRWWSSRLHLCLACPSLYTFMLLQVQVSSLIRKLYHNILDSLNKSIPFLMIKCSCPYLKFVFNGLHLLLQCTLLFMDTQWRDLNTLNGIRLDGDPFLHLIQ